MKVFRKHNPDTARCGLTGSDAVRMADASVMSW